MKEGFRVKVQAGLTIELREQPEQRQPPRRHILALSKKLRQNALLRSLASFFRFLPNDQG